VTNYHILTPRDQTHPALLENCSHFIIVSMVITKNNRTYLIKREVDLISTARW